MNSLKKFKVYETTYGLAVFVIVLLWGTSLLANSYQIISLSPETMNKSVNTQFDVSVLYDVSTGDNTLPGVGIRIHFDSSKLEYISSSNVAAGAASGVILPEEETPRKADYDSETNAVIVVAWYSPNSIFPNQSLPHKLLDLTFKVKTGIPESDTSINVTFTSTSLNYEGKSENSTINIKTMPNVFWTTSSQSILESIGSVNITVQSSFAFDQDIVVPITVSGTANSADHNFSNQSITIISGAVTASKSIEINGDDDVEEDETIVLKIEEPDNAAVLSPDTQTIRIINDDVIQDIPLKEGWNLFSFLINNVYYVSDDPEVHPNVETLTNAKFVHLDSLRDVLDSSIGGKYDIIMNYDANGTQTFDVNAFPEEFNDLKYLASGYGYWINMTSDGILRFQGTVADSSDRLKLKNGWNLIGVWYPAVRYYDTLPQIIEITENMPEPEEVLTLKSVFQSISGYYSMVIGYDVGTKTYDPNIEIEYFNDLNYISPGYGYYIEINTEENNEKIDFHY